MITELVVVGGLLFWLLVIALSIAFFAMLEDRRGNLTGGLFLIIAFLTFYSLFGDLNDYVLGNVLISVAVLAGYSVAGLIWTMPRWYFFVKKLKREILDEKRAFIKEFDIAISVDEKIPSAFVNQWQSRLRIWAMYGISGTDDGGISPPTFFECKGIIATWAVLWPWDIVWFIVSDAVMNTIEFFSDVYTKITKKIFDI